MYNANRAKIIPFPGVSFNHDNELQSELDSFLKQMGYIKAPEVRGCPQSDGFQDEINNFLREMGYIE